MGPNCKGLGARESGNVCFQNYLRDYEGLVNLVAVVDPGLRLNLLLHIGGHHSLHGGGLECGVRCVELHIAGSKVSNSGCTDLMAVSAYLFISMMSISV